MAADLTAQMISKHSFYSVATHLLLILVLSACGQQTIYTDQQFVGSWVSSRTNTPIHMAEGGTWEIKAATGEIMQAGGWEIKGDVLVWAMSQQQGVIRDPNRILKVQGNTFELREQDGSITRFRRVHQ